MYCCLKNADAVSAHVAKPFALVIYNHYLCKKRVVQQCSHDKRTTRLTALCEDSTLKNGNS